MSKKAEFCNIVKTEFPKYELAEIETIHDFLELIANTVDVDILTLKGMGIRIWELNRNELEKVFGPHSTEIKQKRKDSIKKALKRVGDSGLTFKRLRNQVFNDKLDVAVVHTLLEELIAEGTIRFVKAKSFKYFLN